MLAGHDPLDEPRPPPGHRDDAELAGRRGQAGLVLQLFGELRGSPIRLVGSVEVDVVRREGEGLPQRDVHESLSELQTRRQLDAGIACLAGSLADPTSELGRLIPFLRQAKGGGTTKLHVHLEVRVAHGFGQRRQLRQALQPIVRSPQHVEGFVAGLEERQPVLRARGGGEREVDDPEDLLWRARPERVARGLDGEAHADRGIAGGLRVVGQERETLRRRFAGHQKVHDAAVDGSPTGRR